MAVHFEVFGQIHRLFRSVRFCLQADLSFSYSRLIPSGLLGSTGITPLHGYYEPIRLLARPPPAVMDSCQSVAVARWLARSLSSRSCLSARAVPIDPGELNGCAYPLLHRSCWLGPIRRLGHSQLRNEAVLGSLIATARAFAVRLYLLLRVLRVPDRSDATPGRLHG